MTYEEAIKIMDEFFDSLSSYEDGDGNYPCYHVDEEKKDKAYLALQALKSEKSEQH